MTKYKIGVILTVLIAGVMSISTSWAQGNVGYVNSAELADNLPYMLTARKILEEFQTQKQTMFQAMASEGQKKYELYDEKRRNLSESNRLVLEKELGVLEREIQDLQQRLGDTEQRFQDEIAEKQDLVYNPIIQKVTTAIQAVAKEKGYSYVFDISQPGLVYFERGDNLQSLVKTKLGIN